MTSKLEKLQALKSEYDVAVKALGKEALGDAFKAVFDAYPEILAVKWAQYTPYFNDGEPCEFSVGEFYVKKDGPEPDGGYDDEDGFCYLSYSDKTAVTEAVRGLHRTANELEDVFKETFGDHAEVVATREGFGVEEYSHD